MGIAFNLSDTEKKYLGEVAKFGVLSGFANKDCQDMPVPAPGILHEHLGSFVTLTLDGHLRGCIGTMLGNEPLFRNVARMGRAAAFEDPRFPPLSKEEWERTSLEISVLGPLSPCPDVQSVEVGRHGLLLRLGMRSGVFLPKVPVEQGWDLSAYLDNLCRKAGLTAGAWQDPRAELYWYEALVFSVA